MSDGPPDGYITCGEAALRIGVRYHQLRDLTFTGELTGKRVGPRWYIEATSVERYRASRQAGDEAS